MADPATPTATAVRGQHFVPRFRRLDLATVYEEEEGTLREVWVWVRSVFSRWVVATTGGAVVAIVSTYLGLAGPRAEVVRAAFAGLFVFALLAGLFLSWRDEYRGRRRLEGAPSLRLHFVRGVAPFEQRDPVGGSINKGYFFHTARVGVTHDGPRHVEDVRVIVASIEPLPEGFPIKHALALMGDDEAVVTCSVAPGPEPTRFFHLLTDRRTTFTVSVGGEEPRPSDHGVDKPLVWHATKRGELNPLKSYAVRLVAEGRDARSAALDLAVTFTPDGLVPEVRLRNDAPGR